MKFLLSAHFLISPNFGGVKIKSLGSQFGELNIIPRVVNRLHELDFTAEELQEAVNEHKSELDGNPSAYVCTYFKYNEGSLRGLWIDLTSFYIYSDFIDFCKAIHADESDPKLMQ